MPEIRLTQPATFSGPRLATITAIASNWFWGLASRQQLRAAVVDRSHAPRSAATRSTKPSALEHRTPERNESTST
jgi:hypothetical protein